ncbi:uncharacterized protein [Anabrus simplex]|uniref:uncharacterized protein isoform X4 n=1 Tax=Anabrus simplex TaxID=316456 RepID=UPI0034DCC751
MLKAVWKVDENEEAVYIDCEEEENDDDAEYSQWCNLPDLLLEEIFSYLTMRERYYASMVCRSWYRAFHLPNVWSTFVLEDNTLTRRKFNYYYGWQHVLDHLRTHMCLQSIGRNIRHLVFEPMLNFYNLYEFIKMLSYFAESHDHEKLVIGPKIRSLKFTFPCHMAAQEEQAQVYGTGGRLLEAIKELLGNLGSLRRLELVDLMLERSEAQHLLDEVCSLCYLTLHYLIVVNTTKMEYQLLHVGVFLNLKLLSESILTAIDLYRADLWVYGHQSLPRYHQPESFHERVDSLLLLLCRQCPYLHTLVICERISTSTVLLIARSASNLRYLYVRRNAVILECDWPWSPEWSPEFYQWLRSSSRSYEATEKEVSQILGYSWTMLSDRQFKLTRIDLHRSVY